MLPMDVISGSLAVTGMASSAFPLWSRADYKLAPAPTGEPGSGLTRPQ